MFYEIDHRLSLDGCATTSVPSNQANPGILIEKLRED